MMRKLVLAGLLALSLAGVAEARDLTVSWIEPTTYVDGSAIAPGDLTEYRFYCGEALVGTTPAPATTTVIPDVTNGPCEMTATAVVSWGAESDMSNAVLVEGLKPSPPTLLDVIVAWLKSFFGWFV